MLKKTIQIDPGVHSNLRKEAAGIGVRISDLAEYKLNKKLSKKEVNQITKS